MPNYQRDITLTGGKNDFFVAPYQDTYWIYNAPTNGSVTVSKTGKSPQVISSGEVFVVTLSRGEELALSGTSGNVVSLYDHADVKLIPSAKDILGKFNLADSTGANVASVDAAGKLSINPVTANPPNKYGDPTPVSGTTLGYLLLGNADDGLTGLIPVAVNTSGQLDVNVVNTNLSVIAVPQTPVIVEKGNYAPTSRAAASAETIRYTGVASLAGGTQIIYNLSADNLPIAAGVFAYVALKGATSGVYYAVCQCGGSLQGRFTINTAAEKLNIVDRNSEAANAHIFAGSYTAFSTPAGFT